MKNRTFQAAALVALVAVAACDETTSAPDTALAELNDDLALVAADAVAEDLDVMDTMVPLGLVTAPAARAILDYSRTRIVEFYDADGNLQDSYDRLLTASIFSSLEVEGEASRDGVEWSLDRSREMWVTGLLDEETERTFNGNGTEDRSRARVLDVESGATRTYDFTGTMAVEDVVRGVPRSENPWPLSGTITRNVTIEVVNGPRGDETITRLVTITFNGTQYVTLTVNDVEYEVDLAERGRDRVRRRSGGGSSS